MAQQWVLLNISNGSRGIESIIAAESAQIPILVPGILFFIFMIIAGSGFFAQDRRVGTGNLPMWLSISGLITTTGAFILYLYDSVNTGIVLLNIYTVLICVVVTILSTLVFFLSERR